MVTTTSAGPVRSAGLSLLLLSVFYITDSYPYNDYSVGCGECRLRRNTLFSMDWPIYQCQGCCFSMSYPNTLKELDQKNFTSKASCCVATVNPVQVSGRAAGQQREWGWVRNHTQCHCGTCMHHT